MSFAVPKKYIEEGDVIILYLSIDRIHAMQALPQVKSKKGVLVDNVLQTQYGAVKPHSLIGTEYGKKIKLSSGWAYVLQPTPELWTLTLPHRTQIIYTPDISMILMQLEVKPGSIVIESGTGSGSLSHAFIRGVKPHGHLHTFDFHEQRVAIAQEEFVVHGLDKWVTVYHRDVCNNGFEDELKEKADAVFLDLPAPWLVIPHALKCIKPSGGNICSFSPCIEQVQRTCEKLDELGFEEIQTMEIIQTERQVQNRTMDVINLDFLKDRDTPYTPEKKSVCTSVPAISTTGHTGYLTFAILPPIWARLTETTEQHGST